MRRIAKYVDEQKNNANTCNKEFGDVLTKNANTPST